MLLFSGPRLRVGTLRAASLTCDWMRLWVAAAKCLLDEAAARPSGSDAAKSGEWEMADAATEARPQAERVLAAGSVLWDYAHPGPSKTAATVPVSLARWHVLYGSPETNGSAPTVVRCVARSSLRAVMITIREALARSHAAQLAEIPLFAPLDPTELTNLCRRATEVIFPAHAKIQPTLASADTDRGVQPAAPRQADADEASRALGPSSIPSDAFALVVSGDVLVCVDVPPQHPPNAMPHGSDVTLALKAAGLDALQVSPSTQANSLPSRIPLARLSAGRVLGETGALLAPSTISAAAGSEGAVLLCWKREASVLTSLARLPLLLPSSWQAKGPLAVIAHVSRQTAELCTVPSSSHFCMHFCTGTLARERPSTTYTTAARRTTVSMAWLDCCPHRNPEWRAD